MSWRATYPAVELLVGLHVSVLHVVDEVGNEFHFDADGEKKHPAILRPEHERFIWVVLSWICRKTAAPLRRHSLSDAGDDLLYFLIPAIPRSLEEPAFAGAMGACSARVANSRERSSLSEHVGSFPGAT